MSKDVGRFFRHSSIYALGNAVNRLGAFVLLPLYTHFLSVAEYGQLELLYVVASIASGLLSIGIAHATLRFYFDYEEQRDRNAVVSTNLVATLAIGTAGVVPLAFYAEPLARGVLQDGGLALGLRLVLASVVLELASQVCLAYVRARERSLFFVGVAVGKLLVQVAINAVLVGLYDAGVNGVLVGNLSAVAAGFLVLGAMAVRECGLRFEWSKLMPVLKYSFPFLLSTVVGLVSSNVDRLLITGLLDLGALGVYALATKFAKLISDLIGEPFGQAYGAFRYSIMEKGDAAELQARIMRYLLIFCCFAALGLVYFTGPLLRIIAAPEYWDAARLMPLLAAAAVLGVVSYPTQTGIFWSKNTGHVFHIHLAKAAASAVGGLVLILALDLQGACLAVLLTALVSLVMTDRISQRYFPVRYEYGRLAGIAALAVGFGFAALPLEPLRPALELPGKALLLGGFLAAAWRLGLSAGERREAVAAVRARLGR